HRHHKHHDDYQSGGYGHAFAAGGIATKPMAGIMAEAGSPEAVIPLNAQGVGFMSQVMSQMIGMTPWAHQMQATAVNPQQMVFSGTVNNSWNNSTNFDGHWTVVAQDPNEMARQLQQ